MGVPSGAARLLLEQARATPFEGRLLQLGRGTLYFTEHELRSWARQQDFELADLRGTDGVEGAGEAELSHVPALRAQHCLGDVPFFRMLGFEQVESCDIVDWEGADHLFDLNDEVPVELVGRFDAVLETGTITQIFDLPRVLANLHRLLAVGGRVIHCATPSNNHIDLGFVMPCPTLFADFYTANGWEVEAQYLCEYTSYWYRDRLFTPRWDVYDYSPGALDGLSFGRYGGAQAANFVVARKLEGSTGDRTPQLGQYRRTWREFEEGDDPGRAAGQKEEHLRRSAIERLFPGSGLGAVAGRGTKQVGEWLRRRVLPRPMPPRRFRF